MRLLISVIFTIIYSFSVFASTYENTKFNYSINYPDDWEKNQKSEITIEFSSPNKDLSLIVLSMPYNLPLEHFIEGDKYLEKHSISEKTMDRGSCELVGLPCATKKSIYNFEGKVNESYQYLVEKEGVIYWLIGKASPKFTSTQLDQIQNLVQTFRFTHSVTSVQKESLTVYTNPYKHFKFSYPSCWKLHDSSQKEMMDLVLTNDQSTVSVAIFSNWLLKKQTIDDTIFETNMISAYVGNNSDFEIKDIGKKQVNGVTFNYGRIFYGGSIPEASIYYQTIQNGIKYSMIISTSPENYELNKTEIESIIDAFQIEAL